MDNKGQKSGGEFVQLIKGEASQPQTTQVLECVRHRATSNQGSGKAQKKRNRSESSPEQRERKRVADLKYKAKSREKQEEIKSQRDELETENKLLKQEKYETLRKQMDKLERENEQLKRESHEKEQRFNSKLEELHSQNRKLEGELREKENRHLDLTRERLEAEKKLLEIDCQMKLLQAKLPNLWPQNFQPLQSMLPTQPQDHGTSIQRQSYTEQPKFPALQPTVDTLAAKDVPVGHLPAGTDQAHAGSDIFHAAGTDHAHAVCEHNFQPGTGTDVFLGMSILADLSS